MSRLSNLACRAHEVLLGEQVTGTNAQLTTHHLLIQAVVTVDDHLVDAGLFALEHAHFQVNAVPLDFALDGYELIEQVTVVQVQVGNSVIVFLCALGEQLLVIHITLLDTQDLVENDRRIDGVSHPGDVRDVITLALINLEVNVNALPIIGDHAVAHDDSVAVTFLVILVDDELLVGLIIALDELLLRENLQDVLLLIGLLHRALDLAVAQHFIAVDIDLVHLDFLMLVNIDVDDDLVLLAQVRFLDNFASRLAKALVGIVFLNDDLDAVGDIRCHLAAHLEVKALHDVLFLTALHAIVIHLRDAGLLAQVKH